jgi:hypothetical protein
MKMFVRSRPEGPFWVTAFVLVAVAVLTSAAVQLVGGKTFLEYAPMFLLGGTTTAQLLTGRDYWTVDLVAILMVGAYLALTATTAANAVLAGLFTLGFGALVMLRAYRNGGFDA